MSYLLMSPIYGDLSEPKLSIFCLNLKEARGVIDRMNLYINDLHNEVNLLRKELAKYTDKYPMLET